MHDIKKITPKLTQSTRLRFSLKRQHIYATGMNITTLFISLKIQGNMFNY